MKTVDTTLLSAASTQDNLPTLTAPGQELEQYRSLYRPPRRDRQAFTAEALAISKKEQDAVHAMQEHVFQFMMTRWQEASTDTPSLRDYLSRELECEKSMITTTAVIPESADNHDSLKSILDHIYNLYGVGTTQTWHTVVGDQKIYSSMNRLKREYGADLDWLSPYPGDWHLLKIFQPVLMSCITTLAYESWHKKLATRDAI